MNILIIDAFAYANIGSGALIENSVLILENLFPDSKIQILSQFPESVEPYTHIKSCKELIILPVRQAKGKQFVWLFKTITWMLSNAAAAILSRFGIKIPVDLYTFDKDKRKAMQCINDADIIISIGAERINDNFYKALIFALYPLWIIKILNKKLILFPQTIGPFHFKMSRFFAKKILDDCDLIYLRDRKSNDIIKKIGVNASEIVDSYDVAILQKPITADEAEKILADACVPVDLPLLGISALKWGYFKAEGNSRYKEYCESIAKVADGFIENYGGNVVFVATNMPIHGLIYDDVLPAREIISIMENKNRAFVLDRLYTPAEMKGILGRMDICITTRMHACILSTGNLTPTVSINYQFKLDEYMKLLGLGAYSLDIDKVEYEKLNEIFNSAWNNRLNIRSSLEKRIPEIASKIWKDMARVKKFSMSIKPN